jgi:hypothetical protein
MADTEQHYAALQVLNRNYLRSVDEADVAWFDVNLAADFFNTNPDGTLIDRKASLAQIGRGSSVKSIREHDVIIRILGDFAIIHARTSYQKGGRPLHRRLAVVRWTPAMRLGLRHAPLEAVGHPRQSARADAYSLGSPARRP